MKKAAVFTVFFFVLIWASVCYAGDVPEALLHTDGAQLFFGKVKELSDTSITILPLQKIKGEVELGKAVTYSQKIHGWKPQIGKTYLFGYINENNLYFWVADSMDPKTLKLKDANGMDLRLQEYLNNGEFEKAEEARLQKAAAVTAASSDSPTVMPTATLSTLPSMPAPTDSSLPAIASMPETPASMRLSMIIALLAGAVLAVVVFILIITRRKRDGKNG